MSEPPAHHGGGHFLGAVLILIGSLAIYWAGDIPNRGLGANQDPGPRAFPIGLGAFLILGGLYEMMAAWAWRRASQFGNSNQGWFARSKGWLIGERQRDVLILIAALGVYIAAIPWLGFSCSTGLFAMGMMVRLGARWLWAAASAIVLVVIIQLLFVTLFRVQLPPGRIGLPW